MHLQVPVPALASLLSLTSAIPAPVRTVDLVFTGGPASYTITVPADGRTVYTSNSLSISKITTTTPDYDIFSQCFFTTSGVSKVVPTTPNVLSLGPPQPVYAVSCGEGDGNGQCLTDYESCEDEHGQIVGRCCSKYCAATKCRPTS